MRLRNLLLLAILGFELRADVITEWNSLLLQAVKNETTSPPLAARNMAMVHAAMFDAVNTVDRSYQFYLATPSIEPGPPPELLAMAAG